MVLVPCIVVMMNNKRQVYDENLVTWYKFTFAVKITLKLSNITCSRRSDGGERVKSYAANEQKTRGDWGISEGTTPPPYPCHTPLSPAPN